MRSKAIKIVNSLIGIFLPKKLLAKLHVGRDDSLYASTLPDGIKFTQYDEKFEKQMEIAEDIMRKRRELLRELAK